MILFSAFLIDDYSSNNVALVFLMFQNIGQVMSSCNVIRYLVLMRSWYLLSSSHSCLNVQLLARLGLTTPPCWTEEKLRSIQPILKEALLDYWYVFAAPCIPSCLRLCMCAVLKLFVYPTKNHNLASKSQQSPNLIEKNMTNATKIRV